MRLSGVWSPDELVIFVKDAGRGIPRDQMDVILDKFHQDDASDSRNQGGVRLGLAICRAIVAQYGGRISAESGGEDRAAR